MTQYLLSVIHDWDAPPPAAEELQARFDAVDEPDPLARIRAYGRAYVDHAQENPELFKVLVQGMDPGAEAKVENHLPVFHQQVVVTGAAVGDSWPAVMPGNPAQHAVVAIALERPAGRA